MAFTRWKNPYIDRVTTVPEYILDQGKAPIGDEQRALVAAKAAQYQRLFLEFGSGSGGHLLQRAARQPEALFVGFELRFKRIFRTAEKALKLGLSNLLLIRCSSVSAPQLFSPATVDGVYVYFPDPWGKRHWHKHRMLNEHTLNDIWSLLKPSGFLAYKTDHADYFNDTLDVLRHIPGFEVTKTTNDLRNSPYAEGDLLSEFEQLFRSKVVPVNFLMAVKKVTTAPQN